MIRGHVVCTEWEPDARHSLVGTATFQARTDASVHGLFNREVIVTTQEELDAMVADHKAAAKRWEARVCELESRIRQVRGILR